MKWYDWHTVTERLQGRAYALTRGQPYKVILDPTTSTGCCDFTNKNILINPNIFSDIFEGKGLSGKSLDKANFLVSRAITGHETLHVLYSDPKIVAESSESPMLKIVLNILEDARVERIGSITSHVSKTLFRFVNGIAANRLQGFTDTSLSDKSSGISLLLRWRLGAHIPPLEANAQNLWDNVRVLAEKALHAATCSEVLRLAREVVQVLGLDKADDLGTPDDVRDVAERMQSDVVGERSSEPLSNPTKPGSDQNHADPQPEDGEQDSADTPMGNDEAEDAADTDTEDRDQDRGTEDQDSDHGDDKQEHGKEDPGAGPADTSQADSNGLEELEKLIEETAMQVSEDLDSIVPQDADDSNLIAKAKAFRGRRYSDVVASPYANYLSDAVPIATELVRELRAEGPRGSTGASEHPGRFKARYFVRDSTKPFAAQRFQGLTIPKMSLSLIIDRSGSMEHIVYELRTMSMAITVACENLQIPLSVWALEGRVHVKRFDEHGPQVLAKIAGIQADTLTRTMPTISDAVADLRSRPEELKQIVLIHDGMPSDKQDFIEWRTELKGIGLFCLFIMRDEDYPLYQECPGSMREMMDEVVEVRNYAIAPVGGIAKHWCSFIRNKRNSYARPLY